MIVGIFMKLEAVHITVWANTNITGLSLESHKARFGMIMITVLVDLLFYWTQEFSVISPIDCLYKCPFLLSSSCLIVEINFFFCFC